MSDHDPTKGRVFVPMPKEYTGAIRGIWIPKDKRLVWVEPPAAGKKISYQLFNKNRIP